MLVTTLLLAATSLHVLANDAHKGLRSANNTPLPAPAMLLDMTLSADNMLVESVSKAKLSLHNALTPENVSGAKGMAWRLDEYSNYAQGSIPMSGLSTSQLSFSLWCAPETYPVMNANEAVNDYTYMAGNLNEATKSGFAFMISAQGNYKFECFAGGWKVTLAAKEKLPCRTWSHLVATIDANKRTATLYNNGVAVATSRCFAPINVGGESFVVGKSFDEKKLADFHLNTFNGLIDDIAIYNAVLTEEQIAADKPENDANWRIPNTRFAADLLRPAFHGMPEAAWTNETHGAFSHNGQVHLFFQKNANGPYMARLHWGQLTTTNLYKWKEQQPALAPAESYDTKGCWSGCVFADEALTNGKPNIFYTAVDNAKATIAQAMPTDNDLLVWQKMANNPIINGRPQGLSDDFRDPYVFKHNGLYMVVGTSKNGIGATTLHHYDKTTKTWSNDGTTFFEGSNAASAGTFWEMPVVVPLGNKWLFAVTPLNTAQGVETIYWTGDITDNGQFNPTSSPATSPAKLELEGFSKQGFGLLSPTIFSHQGKTLLMGIVPDRLPAAENYRLGWAHTYSLPREINLDANGLLVQKPYSGLQQMRSKLMASLANTPLNGEETLGEAPQRKFEIEAEFTVGTANMGLQFYKNSSKAAKIFYRPSDNNLVVDLTSLSRLVNDAGTFNGLYTSPLPQKLAKGSTLRLHVFVDRSIADVFVNNTWAFSIRLFPTDANANAIAVFGDRGAELRKVDCWTLDENATTTGIQTIETQQHTLCVERNRISIDAEGMQCQLEVFDLAGRLLKAKTAKRGPLSIDMQPKGVYLVRYAVGAQSKTQKVCIN